MTNLDKAREWADRWEDGSEENDPFIDREELAAIKLIKSLPDQWVETEEVKAIIEEMNEDLEAELLNDYGQGYNYSTRHWREALESLFTPKLPTLAEMTEEERKACVGMQADYSPLGEPVERVAIMGITEFGAILMSQNWERSHREAGRITPLPGEPKLKWPGSEPPALPEGMRLADHEEYGRVVVSPYTDAGNDYRVFYSRDRIETETGASWGYAHKSGLTFLDGGE